MPASTIESRIANVAKAVENIRRARARLDKAELSLSRVCANLRHGDIEEACSVLQCTEGDIRRPLDWSADIQA